MKKETKEVGRELRPGKGILRREVSKHQETLSLLSLWWALEAQRATEQEGKLNKWLKPTDYKPNSNSPSEEAAQMPASTTSKWRLGKEAQEALAAVLCKIWAWMPRV